MFSEVGVELLVVLATLTVI